MKAGRGRFSSRTSWDLSPNRLTARWNELIRDGTPVLDLTESNPTRCELPYPTDRIREAMADAGGLRYDPDPRGLRSAREMVARELDSPRSSVDPDSIVLCSGTSEAYSWLFKLLCEPGDQVLVPAPSYPLLDFLAHLEDIELVRYPLHYDGEWHVDPDEIADLCGNKSRAVVIIQPNNPTGSYFPADELARLRALLDRRGATLISDEVFRAYGFDPAAPPIPSALEGDGGLTFALGGLSKSAGLPQMKLAWIAIAGPSEQKAEAIERLEMVADTFLSVNTPVQTGLRGLLDAGATVRDSILTRVRENRSALLELQSLESSWRCLDARAGWYAILQLPRIHTDEEWCFRFLERDHVHVHPGRYYDFPDDGHVVVSLLPPESKFRDGMSRILSRVEQSSLDPT